MSFFIRTATVRAGKKNYELQVTNYEKVICKHLIITSPVRDVMKLAHDFSHGNRCHPEKKVSEGRMNDNAEFDGWHNKYAGV